MVFDSVDVGCSRDDCEVKVLDTRNGTGFWKAMTRITGVLIGCRYVHSDILPLFFLATAISKIQRVALVGSIEQCHDMARYLVHPFYRNVASHTKSSFSQTWCSTFPPEATRTISLNHFL